MKKIYFLILGIMLAGFLQAQEKKAWKQMDDFHAVMSSTFHPAEEGNLEPVKKRSGEMVEKAIAWQHADAPVGYNKKKIKKSLNSLVKESKNLDKLIKNNAADKQLAGSLSHLHDIFHAIMENCEDK